MFSAVWESYAMRGPLESNRSGPAAILALVGVLAVAALGSDGTLVRFDTAGGSFDVLLYDETTRETVENFLSYVCSGRYDDTIFHRLVPDFVLQGGGFTYDHGAVELGGDWPIPLDAQIPNTRGTIAMARTNDPNSADRQFYFNLVDNTQLDGPNGYAVFGEVVGNGMDVIDQLAAQRPWDASAVHYAWDKLPMIDYQLGSPIGDYLEWLYSVNVTGDMNDDGYVDEADLDGIVMAAWGASVAAGELASGDASGDGFVGQADLDTILANWNGGLVPAVSTETRFVPEPSLAVLLACGAMAIARKRRR